MSVSGSDSVNTPKFIFTMIIPSQDGLLKKKTETHSDFVPYSLKLPITSEMNLYNQHWDAVALIVLKLNNYDK